MANAWNKELTIVKWIFLTYLQISFERTSTKYVLSWKNGSAKGLHENDELPRGGYLTSILIIFIVNKGCAF